MAVEPCVRVCLHLSDIDEETCWFLVDFKKMPTIECIQRVIGQKFYKNETSSFKLTLKGGLLPAWESSLILRDDDQVIVEHEATSCHSSEFWSKKRKRKKKPTGIYKKSCFSPSAKHNSLECNPAKCTGTLVVNQESILTPKISVNSVSTLNAEGEEAQEKNKKKKKKKASDGANELKIDKEEIPAPNKKQKLSKSPRNELGHKKKNVTKESKPELIEIVKDHVKIISLQSEKQKEGKANLCDKSGNPRGLKRIKSEIIKVLDEVSVNLDNTILKETSDATPNMKDVSKVVKENSAEENASLTQFTDNYAKYLRKDAEPSAKSSRSDLEKSYNIPEESSSRTAQEKGNTVLTQLSDNIEKRWGKDFSSKSSISDVEKSFNVQEELSSHSVEEKFEVYKIGTEDLKNLCQSLTDGETLTIDQDKVKVIDVENSSNSSWLDCVEVDSSFPDETKKHDKSTSQERSKGSGNLPRRRRRRRGQRSFACSPFIHEMSQSLDSEADNRSPVSTPVTSQPSKRHSSSNNSQKHFHFESESDEDDVDEENISHLKMVGAGDPKSGNNFESSKSTLSSDKTVMNGAEDSNSSMVLQGEEKNILSSSQKHTPKKSVHFALENNSCQSFDNNEGPIIFKRGQNSNQRRAYPTLMRQQQLNSEDDRDSTSVNCSLTKPSKEYNLLPSIVGYPRAGDKIAFKRLEIGDDYTPRLSDFIEAKVISFQEDTKKLTMKITSSQNNRKKEGKFELFYEDDKDIMILDQQDDEPEIVELSTLQEVKLLK